MAGHEQVPGHPAAVNPGPNSRIQVPASALAGHQFLRGMPADHLGLLAGAASLVHVPAGHRFFGAGRMPHQFWLIRAGQVGLHMDVPGRRITVHGRVAQVKDERTIYNPSYQLQPGPD